MTVGWANSTHLAERQQQVGLSYPHPTQTWAFDQVCSARHGLHPVEQASAPTRDKLGPPITELPLWHQGHFPAQSVGSHAGTTVEQDFWQQPPPVPAWHPLACRQEGDRKGTLWEAGHCVIVAASVSSQSTRFSVNVHCWAKVEPYASHRDLGRNILQESN